MAKKKLTPRANFIATADLKKLAGYAWDAMQQASTHDPDILRWMKEDRELQTRRFSDSCARLSILERQMERIGAPQYRVIRKGKR